MVLRLSQLPVIQSTLLPLEQQRALCGFAFPFFSLKQSDEGLFVNLDINLPDLVFNGAKLVSTLQRQTSHVAGSVETNKKRDRDATTGLQEGGAHAWRKWRVTTGNKRLRIKRHALPVLGVWLHLSNIEISTPKV